MEATVPLVIAVVSVFLLALGAIADDRRTRIRRLAPVRVELPLLHSINDDRCIGCEACVDVCPTEVLDLVDHKVRVARFSDCVQCEQCANACPTTALVMYREGGAPQTLTVPELDDNFMTGVPNQYLIGEVAGKPLVKNAANLGRAVIEHIARELAGKPAGAPDLLDVAIVGSGPGGLSAGLTCLVKKLSCVVLEKEHVLASTVARYPKGKLFMAEPADSGNLSYLPVFDATKEQLVSVWQTIAEKTELPVKLGEAVETVQRGDDGLFTIKTTVATYRARMVVLATGLRGKPRLLAVPGANLEKVQSRLEDPDAFGGKHVLVVGGGDSAVEAAMSLVDAGATVTLSYRGDGFKRCKQGNQKRLAELTAANTLPVLLESNVKEFTADRVTIKLKDGTTTTIANEHAFVLIGADTPVAWLENSNVRFVEREHLYALGSTQDVVRRVAPDAVECTKLPDEAVAIVLGKTPARPAHRPPQRPEHSVVSRIREELSHAVSELSGVFKLSDLGGDLEDKPRGRTPRARTRTPRPQRAQTQSQLIPAAQLTRTPAPKLFARHDAEKPYTPLGTTVEMMSLPALLKERAEKKEAAARRATPPIGARAIGFGATPVPTARHTVPRASAPRSAAISGSIPSIQRGFEAEQTTTAVAHHDPNQFREDTGVGDTVAEGRSLAVMQREVRANAEPTTVEGGPLPRKAAPVRKTYGSYGPLKPSRGADPGVQRYPTYDPDEHAVPVAPPPVAPGPPPTPPSRSAKGSAPPPIPTRAASPASAVPERILRKRAGQ